MGAAGGAGRARKQDQAPWHLSSPEFPVLPAAGSFIFPGGAEVSPGARRKSLLTQTFLIASRKNWRSAAGSAWRGLAGTRRLWGGSASGSGLARALGAGASRGRAGALGTSPAAPCAWRWREVVRPRRGPCTPGCSADSPPRAASPRRSPHRPTHGALFPLGTGVGTVTPTGSGGATLGCCGGTLGDHPAVPWLRPLFGFSPPHPWVQPFWPPARPQLQPRHRVVPTPCPRVPAGRGRRSSLVSCSFSRFPVPRGSVSLPELPRAACPGRARGDSGLVPRRRSRRPPPKRL